MNRKLLEWLCCPCACGELALSAERWAGDEIEEGLLRAPCGLEFPIRNGIPRFVSSDGYCDSFSFEWKVHRRTQLDSANVGTRMAGASESAFATRVGFPLSELAGKLVLDAGCGAGRYAEVAAKHGAVVVAIDLSFSVDAARENLRGLPNVHVIQADIFSLPFSPGTFDFVYSFGVLHQTPDCEKAFKQLPRLLKSGGKLSVAIYSSYNKAIVYSSEAWRSITTRLPKKLLYCLSFVSVPLYFIYRIPVIGHICRGIFVIPMLPDWRWRVLDTYDWYSARYQSKHTHWEVFRWFEDEGLTDIKVNPGEVTMLGTKI